MSARKPDLEPRLRFFASVDRGFGPGKAELLRNIASLGSITRSAARMKMSYNRAWILVREMNSLFREPLVVTRRGGSGKGGASLTAMGLHVATLYDRMEADCRRATLPDWTLLRRKIRKVGGRAGRAPA
jgi:molybdate transport system regulatory protein